MKGIVGGKETKSTIIISASKKVGADREIRCGATDESQRERAREREREGVSLLMERRVMPNKVH